MFSDATSRHLLLDWRVSGSEDCTSISGREYDGRLSDRQGQRREYSVLRCY